MEAPLCAREAPVRLPGARAVARAPPRPYIWHAIDDVLGDVRSISEDPYGNFVVQHILEHGGDEHRGRIVRALGADLRSAATHPNVCQVLNKALIYAAPEDQRSLVVAVVSQGLLADMAVQRTGFATTQRLLEVATGPLLQEAHQQLRADARRIESTKHGLALLDLVSRESPLVDICGMLASASCGSDEGPSASVRGRSPAPGGPSRPAQQHDDDAAFGTGGGSGFAGGDPPSPPPAAQGPCRAPPGEV